MDENLKDVEIECHLQDEIRQFASGKESLTLAEIEDAFKKDYTLQEIKKEVEELINTCVFKLERFGASFRIKPYYYTPKKTEVICLLCEKPMTAYIYLENKADYKGGRIQVSFGFGSRYDSTESGYPMGFEEPRDVRLTCCNEIVSYICDDCFEKKAHLFEGYNLKKSKVIRTREV